MLLHLLTSYPALAFLYCCLVSFSCYFMPTLLYVCISLPHTQLITIPSHCVLTSNIFIGWGLKGRFETFRASCGSRPEMYKTAVILLKLWVDETELYRALYTYVLMLVCIHHMIIVISKILTQAPVDQSWTLIKAIVTSPH